MKEEEEEEERRFSYTPGYINAKGMIRSIANWTLHEDGIRRADIPINLDKWLLTEETKEMIVGYRSITLEDDTIIGYVRFISVETEYLGSVENKDAKYEYITGVLSEIAKCMNFSSYTSSGEPNMYFIITKPKNQKRLQSYFLSSSKGNTK